MRLIRISSFLLCCMASFAGFSQQNPSGKSFVVYDPLFWHKQLNLKPGQYKKIAQINIEFYQTLSSVSREHTNDPSGLRSKVAESLEHRSEQIWSTFYPNQRRKWQKIMNENANNKI